MDKCKVCGCTDDHACPGGCYWVEPGLCSTCANKVAEKVGNKVIAGVTADDKSKMEPSGILAEEEVPAAVAKALPPADLSNKRCIVRPFMTKPGQIFNLSGVGYKVAGDGSFHRLTEPKPSRKAWKRQQVEARKAERERKRRVKGW